MKRVLPPLWWRVALIAQQRAVNGRVHLEHGELRRALGVATTSEVSRAIRTAIRFGWLAEYSRTCELILPTRVPTTDRVTT